MNSNLCEQFFAALADRNRLSIVNSILEKDKTVNEISESLGIEQSLVSHHLKALKDHGFVDFKVEGKNRMYSSNKETLRPLMDIMRSHTSKFCGFACEYKVEEWSKSDPVKAIGHETEVVMQKISILRKYSTTKIKSTKKLEEASDFFNKQMTTHFKAEEMTLFRALKQREETSGIVSELLSEHKIMREKFLELQNAVKNYSKSKLDRLKKVTDDIVKTIYSHIDKEENVLIPKAKKILSKKEFEDIEKESEKLEVLVDLHAF